MDIFLDIVYSDGEHNQFKYTDLDAALARFRELRDASPVMTTGIDTVKVFSSGEELHSWIHPWAEVKA
jgi:hypothetical protein